MADTGTDMNKSRATVGIISLGDMGSGLARLLVAHGYTVVTNVEGRSQETRTRALQAGAVLLPTFTALITTCDVLLSVVPPRDAHSTAQRVLTALESPETARQKKSPLYFADMNAVSPRSVKGIASLFGGPVSEQVCFIDGSILGGPPSPPPTSHPSSAPPQLSSSTLGVVPPEPVKPGSSSSAVLGEGWIRLDTPSSPPDQEESPGASWTRPLLPTSGPHSLSSIPDYGPHLAAVLRNKHISSEIGAASGLKMCFASLSKGYAAIAVQAVTTARRLGVFSDLEDSLRELAPGNLERMQRAVVGMAPKAYRWVREMEEISATHAGEDGDEGFAPEYIFRGAADVFRTVAEDTVLGKEKVGKRERGKTAEDVAEAMVEGLRTKKRTRSET